MLLNSLENWLVVHALHTLIDPRVSGASDPSLDPAAVFPAPIRPSRWAFRWYGEERCRINFQKGGCLKVKISILDRIYIRLAFVGSLKIALNEFEL